MRLFRFYTHSLIALLLVFFIGIFNKLISQTECNCSLLKQNSSESISIEILLESKDPICKAVGLTKKLKIICNKKNN